MTSAPRRGAQALSLAALALAALSPGGARAQAAERAVFLVRVGRDTFAVERSSISRTEATSTLTVRTPMVRFQRDIAFSPTGTAQRVTTTFGFGQHGDSAVRRTVLVADGDSATVRAEDPSGAGTPPPAQRIAMPRGSVPFINLSGQTLELLLRRARALGGDPVQVPMLLPNAQVVPVTVRRIGADSAGLIVGGVEIRVRTDAVGRMLGGVVPMQGAYFERLPGDSPVASWQPSPPDYSAPAGAPYRAEAMSLRTPAGITLAGTLTMPAHAAGRRVPAVVLITGSGSQDRDEAIAQFPGYRPFREIADTLSRRGIAVLRLDDRGIGGSEQGPLTATSADFADDIRAAVLWLRARPDVDPARVGLVGHSEGAMIAPMIAATDSRLRAIALIAAPALKGRDIMAAQRRAAIEHDTSIPIVKRDSVSAALTRTAEAAYAQPGWLHFFADYDPRATARRVLTPTLILQGETDTQVSPEQATLLADAMRAGGNRRVTVRTFPRMNHLMVEDAFGDFRAYDRLRNFHVRRDFLGVLSDWLAATL